LQFSASLVDKNPLSTANAFFANQRSTGMYFAKVVPQLFLVAGILAGSAGAAQAQPSTRVESSWRSLGSEPSRGELFKQHVKEMATVPAGQPAAFAFPSEFHFPHDAGINSDGTTRHDTIFGIDISHYEGSAFPLGDLKRQSVAFIYVKATQGTDYADKTFDHNWRTVAALPDDKRIPRGAFHFLSSEPKMSGKDQADSFVNYVKLHGNFQAGDLPPAVDLEWDIACKGCPDRWQTRHRTPDQIVNTTVDFLNQVKALTGRTPMIYTNKSFLRDNHVTDPALVQKLTTGFKVWIFDLDGHDRKVELPNPADNLDHVLWQFSFTGVVGGYSGNFDVDVFKGTANDFISKLLSSD
jgi:lysozyme